MTATADAEDVRRYGTVEGVFVPTLLTILGVILFLRTGWVVGNAGLLGASAIIVVAFVITGSTALSLASISTNVTPGAGGAYALIARSFGVEAGGAVGIPLYLSQSMVIVLYTFGFRDGWLTIFPGHPALLVDAGVVAALVGITLISTRVVFRLQYLILGVVAVALGAVAVAAITEPMTQRPDLIGSFPGAPEDGFPGTDVWVVFAVFFPATTGVMAGLNMSGELRAPGRSILRGTLSALAVSAVIYLGVAVWLAFAVPAEELVSDYLVMAERSAWAPAVLAGVLAATFSSALASLVGAPRILQALAEHRVTPGAAWLRRRDRRGEPRNALLVTIAVVAATVLLRDLNAIAPLITMVFLLTYGAINLAVLAETLVDLPSYRPTFKVPWAVPLIGAVGCAAAMVIIDALFTGVALLAGIGVLGWLARRQMERPVTDIRGAVLLVLAQWATRTARRIPISEERTWTPRLLVPIADTRDLERAWDWLPELADESVPVRLVSLHPRQVDERHRAATERLRDQLLEDGVDATASTVEVAEVGRGAAAALLAAGDEGDPRASNVVVSCFPEDRDDDTPARRLLREAFAGDTGVILTPPSTPQPRDERPVVALWVRGQGPTWQVTDHLPHSDLALLFAYRLVRSWGARIRLITAVPSASDVEPAEGYLREMAEVARLRDPDVQVVHATFEDALEVVPPATVHVMALSSQVDFEPLREVRERLADPVLFIRDSGVENAFA